MTFMANGIFGGGAKNIVIRPVNDKIIRVVDISDCENNDTFSVARGCRVVKLVDGAIKGEVITDGNKRKIFERGENKNNLKILATNENVNYDIKWGVSDLYYKTRGIETNSVGLNGEVVFSAPQLSFLIEKGIYEASAEKIRAVLITKIREIATAAFSEVSNGARINEIGAKGAEISAILKNRLQRAADELGYPVIINSVTANIYIPEAFMEEVKSGTTGGIFGAPINSGNDNASLLEKWGGAGKPKAAESKPKICTRCGHENPADTAYCGKCGKKL